jgi:gliding motility-associated-like protein
VLTITDPLNGCFSTSTVNVTQSSNQPIITANSNSPICINNTINLSSSTGSNYLWQGPNGFTSSIQNPSITNATTNMSGTYTITITDTTNNCLSTATVNVIVNPLPLVTAFSNSPVCIGGVINLNSTISNANAYSWAGPDNFYSTSINPNINNASVDMAGNYTLTVQSSQGCYNASVVSVSVFSQPDPPQVSPVRLCQFSQANPLTAIQSIGANLNWYGSNQTGGNFSINAPIPNTDSVGIYPYYVSQALQGCESPRIPLIVTILPIPTGTLNVIEPKCAPLCDTIKLSTTSSINFYQWNLGNGNINSNNNSISYCYQNPGNYSISVKITDTSGCINNLLFTNWVNVNENPSADFNITPDDITLFDPQILFINQSTGDNIINYSWNFGDSTTFTTTLPNTIHSYTNPGEYIVTLIIKNNLGCSDTAKVKFEVLDEFNVYIPNTFTPNGDNINEEFYPIGSGFLEDNYLMEIYDRWGELIFTSNKYSIHWKGLRNNDSEAVLQDTYIYKISFQTVMGYSANKTGQIKLIR